MANKLWLGLRGMEGLTYPGLQGCDRASGKPPDEMPSSPWGVLGADRAPALPKFPEDLKKIVLLRDGLQPGFSAF